VALDTGSTDLWYVFGPYVPRYLLIVLIRVNPPGGIGQFNDTGILLEINYGDGSYGVDGTIGVAPFTFSNYEVAQQAFLDVTTETIGGLAELGIYGLLGLSFDFGNASRINAAIKRNYGNSSTWGQSVLHNIFDQHPNQPNFIAISLSRTDDLEDTVGGSFYISEYDPTYASVAEEPQLPQFPEGGTRWTALLESILIDGSSVPVTSTIENVPPGRGVALLDTGTPSGVLPTAVWDGIYSSIPGAVKYSGSEESVWFIPCNTTSILELGFGYVPLPISRSSLIIYVNSGKAYPIHPLDLSTISSPFTVDGESVVACASAFKPSDIFAPNGFEYLLGASFLRNVYSA
jgi:saccharopepsin